VSKEALRQHAVGDDAARVAPGELVADGICDGGDLDCGSGLLLIIRAAMNKLQDGQILEIHSTDIGVKEDLPAWCRMTENEYMGRRPGDGHWQYMVRRGRLAEVGEPDWGIKIPARDGSLDMRDWFLGRLGEVPEEAPRNLGFVPRGAVPEKGVPTFNFTVNRKNDIWADDIAELYQHATANQWDASRDIPWDKLQTLDDDLERAVCQTMTFLAENEYSALYVPGKFIGKINPQYTEVVLFLATVMNDEARHIEVFTKRAVANGGGLQYGAAATEMSLKTLLDQEDYPSASFLLHVLGEGTFVDLLQFIEKYAPDECTREIVRRARIDETRHVKYGMSNVRWALRHEPELMRELLKSVEQRAAVLDAATGVQPMVQESLAILAGGGSSPEQMVLGVERGRKLYETMHRNRMRRLTLAGFDAESARYMSELHTPNFM
jgi:TusA-related sulfurtransferase